LNPRLNPERWNVSSGHAALITHKHGLHRLPAYEGTVNAIRRAQYVTLLQIDAKVNPGNSGGPVLNDHVIGIVVAKLEALNLVRTIGTIPERINFAISINDAHSHDSNGVRKRPKKSLSPLGS